MYLAHTRQVAPGMMMGGETIPTGILHVAGLALAILLACASCASRIPADLACPEFPEPVFDLASDAVPPALACAAAPEPAAYLATWKSQLHEHWIPADLKGGTGTTAAIFTMSHSGTVGRFCIDAETRPHLRDSVVSALDSFEPDAAPSEVVAGCLAGKRFRAQFKIELKSEPEPEAGPESEPESEAEADKPEAEPEAEPESAPAPT